MVLLRHGESQWNLENRFTGWVDVPLSPRGEQEAKEAGQKLQTFRFNHAFTSVLTRAIKTLEFVLEEIKQKCSPVPRQFKLRTTSRTKFCKLGKVIESRGPPGPTMGWGKMNGRVVPNKGFPEMLVVLNVSGRRGYRFFGEWHAATMAKLRIIRILLLARPTFSHPAGL